MVSPPEASDLVGASLEDQVHDRVPADVRDVDVLPGVNRCDDLVVAGRALGHHRKELHVCSLLLRRKVLGRGWQLAHYP